MVPIVLFAVAFVATAWMIWSFYHSITRRVTDLHNYLIRILQGKEAHLSVDPHHDELTELREAFLRLHAQTEQSRRELESNYRQLQLSNMQVEEKYAQAYTLQLIQEEISRELDSESLLKKAVDIVIGVLGCKFCCIYLIDDKGETLQSCACSGIIGDLDLPQEVAVNSTHLLAHVFHQKVVHTYKNRSMGAWAGQFKNYVAVPLIGRRSVLGVMLFEQELLDSVTEDLVDFARLIAQELSLSVENAFLYARMKQMAIYDNLTGVFNRMYLMNYVDELFYSHAGVVSVIILDIDHFKIVNDRFGHLCGDVVLKTVASLIREAAESEGVVARYGGEEFVVILPGMDCDQALAFAERIRRLISDHQFVSEDGTRIPVTISAGLACYPIDADNYERLLYLADVALYEAKNTGRNQVCVAKAQNRDDDNLNLFQYES